MQVPPSLPPVLQPLADLPGAAARTRTRDARGANEGVRLSLSDEGRRRSETEATDLSGRPRPTDASGEPLSQEDARKLAELQRRDREVRAHEAAHQAAAGHLARGGPSFTYETGPDGQRYAVAGEVKIDASPVPGDPAATARKMQRVRAAALAPADPSSTDRSVAAKAAQEAVAARAEAAQAAREEDAAVDDGARVGGGTSTAEGLGSGGVGGSSADEASNALARADEQTSSATGGCPVCQAQGHGPEHHRGDVDTFA